MDREEERPRLMELLNELMADPLIQEPKVQALVGAPLRDAQGLTLKHP